MRYSLYVKPARIQHVAGKVIGGRYELAEIAGKGGMATVWRANLHGAANFHRTVAVKQMHEHLCNKPLYVKMFCEEARMGSALQNPNIAQVYDFIQEDGQYYLVMEWVDGTDLGSVIHYFRERGQKPRWEIVTAIGIGILRGLAAAHMRVDESGAPRPIIHRDISPHNILVSTDGLVKLIDFGLSYTEDRESSLTEPGVVKGKMSYLSPEIVQGERASEMSDVFAVGSVLWEALVGRKLFDGDTDLEVFSKLRNAQIQPLRPLRRDIPKGLVTVINKALAPRPEDRWESALALANRLSHVLKSSKVEQDPRALLGSFVIEARRFINQYASGRLSHSSSVTPLADLELPVTAREVERPRQGLLHSLPFFGRRRQ